MNYIVTPPSYAYDGAVREFRDEFMCYSNFYNAPVWFGGVEFAHSEAAFQAGKIAPADRPDSLHWKLLQNKHLRPAAAKAMGARVPLRADWNEGDPGCEGLILMEVRDDPDAVRARLIERHTRKAA